jgi:hypothetical protein
LAATSGSQSTLPMWSVATMAYNASAVMAMRIIVDGGATSG